MVTEIYIGGFTSNHMPLPYGYPVIVVRFLAGCRQVNKHERKSLSCTIWTPIAKNLCKTCSVKVQGDFYLKYLEKGYKIL